MDFTINNKKISDNKIVRILLEEDRESEEVLNDDGSEASDHLSDRQESQEIQSTNEVAPKTTYLCQSYVFYGPR